MTYVTITNKIKVELNIRINSWVKKTSWRQNKTKPNQKTPNSANSKFAFPLQKKKGKNTTKKQ